MTSIRFANSIGIADLSTKFRLPVTMTRRLLWRSGVIRSKPWDGNTIAIHDLRAIYYRVPKVASSSLTATCVDLMGFRLPEDSWKPAVFRNQKLDDFIDTRRRDRAKIDVWEANRLNGYWRFAFVRNPYDRLVSCYSEKIRDNGPADSFVGGVSKVLLRYGRFFPGMSFTEFARAVAEIPDADADPHFRSQFTFISDRRGNLTMDFVGRFESLEKDIERVAQHLGAAIEMPHLLKSTRRDYQSYYDDSTRKLVRNRFAEDFSRLGYVP